MDDASGETIAFLVGDAARLFRQRFEDALAAAGLDITAGEARTLYHAAKGAGARQAVLAERMNIEPMTLVNFLDRLESRGWIVREPDPGDRRAKIVRVTAAARPLVERVDEVAAGVRARACAGLSARDVAAVRRGLQAMRMNLSGEGEGRAP
jgi:DNA-binding MarR family transcriptional regulator